MSSPAYIIEHSLGGGGHKNVSELLSTEQLASSLFTVVITTCSLAGYGPKETVPVELID